MYASLLRLSTCRVAPLVTSASNLGRSVPQAVQLCPRTFKSGLATETATPKTARKPRAAPTKTATKAKSTTKAKSATKAKPKTKAAPVKKAKKPAAKKVVKAKPWHARGADGKLLPLPSATKPKKRSPFIHYVQYRARTLRSDPAMLKKGKDGSDTLDVTKMAKRIGEEWNSFTEAEKKPYLEEGEADKKAYEVAMVNWRGSLTAEDIRRQNAYTSEMRKKGKKGTALLRDPKKPTRPQSAFFSFLKDFRKRATGLSAIEVARQGGAEWKTMSQEAKAPYAALEAKAREQHVRDVQQWKAQA